VLNVRNDSVTADGANLLADEAALCQIIHNLTIGTNDRFTCRLYRSSLDALKRVVVMSHGGVVSAERWGSQVLKETRYFSLLFIFQHDSVGKIY